MKKYITIIILAFSLTGIMTAGLTHADTIGQLPQWIYNQTTKILSPRNTNSIVQVPSLGSTGNPCVSISDTSGTFATSTCSGGGGGGSATTTITAGATINGPSFTFASSSDTNLGLQMTGSGSTITFAPQWSGQLSAARGGTGTNTLASLTVGSNLSITGGQNVLIGTSTQISLGSNVVTTLATGTAGNIFNGSIGSNTLTLNLPYASGSNTGQLQSSDWTTFNNKVGGSGTATQVAFFSAGSTLSSDSNLYWDNVNKALGVDGTPGSEILYVGGKTGINTTTGASTLHVVAGGGQSPFTVASSSGSSYLTVTSAGNIGVSSSSPVGRFVVQGSATDSTKDFYFTDSNNKPLVVFQDNGNVGIGSNSPTAPLAIGTNGVNTLPTNTKIWISGAGLGATTTPQARISLGADANQNYGAYMGEINLDGSFNQVAQFGTRVNGTDYPALNLNQGNVGIGTTTPGGVLSLVGGDRGTGLIVTSAANNNASIDLIANQAGGHDYQILSTPSSAGIGAGGFALYDNTASRYDFTILSSGRMGVNINTSTLPATFNVQALAGTDMMNIASSSGTSALYVAASGNVGIGTTTPSQLLNVYGNLLAATSSTYTLFANTATQTVSINTSTTANVLTIQGVTTKNPLVVASSSGTSILTIFSDGGLNYATSTLDATTTAAFAGQYYSAYYDNGTTTATSFTIDWGKSNVQRLGMNASSAITLTFANYKPGGRYLLMAQQSTTTAETITWPGALHWSGGTAPTLTSGTYGQIDLITFVCGVTNCYGASNTNFSP